MKKRYKCPKHEESTASAVVYGQTYHCFGCGANGPVTELGLSPTEKVEPEYVENLDDTIQYIRLLPTGSFRGFELHCNRNGYYLVWPDSDYYKFRRHAGDPKYKGPTGYKKPPFVVRKDSLFTLCLVEGEFNALTLGELDLNVDIVSPGGAGDFYSAQGKKYLPYYAMYDTVYIIVDSDAAGIQAAIETKVGLMSHGCRDVKVVFMEKDFNDIFTQEGKAAAEHRALEMGLPTGVQHR
jgi:hypothetical protein